MMPFTDTSLHEEYAGAVEWVAARTLDAVNGAGNPGLTGDAWSDRYPPKTLLAAVRVVGPDLLAAHALTDAPVDVATADLAGQALRIFPGEGATATATDTATAEQALTVAWRDWATAELLARHGYGSRAPQPGESPVADADEWQAWSARMAQLSCLALPGLDSAVHQDAVRHESALSRGAARAMMRRDLRSAARLARWLAWLAYTGRPTALEAGPVLRHIDLTEGGSARTALDVAVGQRLLATRE